MTEMITEAEVVKLFRDIAETLKPDRLTEDQRIRADALWMATQQVGGKLGRPSSAILEQAKRFEAFIRGGKG